MVAASPLHSARLNRSQRANPVERSGFSFADSIVQGRTFRVKLPSIRQALGGGKLLSDRLAWVHVKSDVFALNVRSRFLRWTKFLAVTLVAAGNFEASH